MRLEFNSEREMDILIEDSKPDRQSQASKAKQQWSALLSGGKKWAPFSSANCGREEEALRVLLDPWHPTNQPQEADSAKRIARNGKGEAASKAINSIAENTKAITCCYFFVVYQVRFVFFFRVKVGVQGQLLVLIPCKEKAPIASKHLSR